MDNKHKYIKYKSKYLKLKLKSLQTGGGMKHIHIDLSPYIEVKSSELVYEELVYVLYFKLINLEPSCLEV